MASAPHTLTADRGDAGHRLDLVIRRHLAGLATASRTRVQAWIEAGQVSVNVTVTGLTISNNPIRRVKLARPRTTDACSVPHPSGSSSMHGSFVAVGTACAISCMVRPVPQSAFPTSPQQYPTARPGLEASVVRDRQAQIVV